MIALAGILLLSPLYCVLALLIKLDSKGPVFFRAKRIGKNGHVFDMLKFRSMIPDASIQGPPLTTQYDVRITRIGRILRKFKLDELPQLLNVLKGEMKFVGARPEDPGIVKRYTSDQRKIFDYTPGITSPASLTFRDEERLIPSEDWEQVYMKDILPKKLTMDLEYMKRANFLSDIGVILRTLGVLK